MNSTSSGCVLPFKKDISVLMKQFSPRELLEDTGTKGQMIIGLTGKNGSGKGEAAKFLKERGFQYHSLSDVVREETAKQGKALTRANLIRAGNDLRKKS